MLVVMSQYPPQGVSRFRVSGIWLSVSETVSFYSSRIWYRCVASLIHILYKPKGMAIHTSKLKYPDRIECQASNCVFNGQLGDTHTPKNGNGGFV